MQCEPPSAARRSAYSISPKCQPERPRDSLHFMRRHKRQNAPSERSEFFQWQTMLINPFIRAFQRLGIFTLPSGGFCLLHRLPHPRFCPYERFIPKDLVSRSNPWSNDRLVCFYGAGCTRIRTPLYHTHSVRTSGANHLRSSNCNTPFPFAY